MSEFASDILGTHVARVISVGTYGVTITYVDIDDPDGPWHYSKSRFGDPQVEDLYEVTTVIKGALMLANTPRLIHRGSNQ